MADLKISALPAATTPLAGTEVLPIVQSGSTVKVSVANLTAGREVSAESVLITNNVGIGTTSPLVRLEVAGTTGANQAIVTASISGTFSHRFPGINGRRIIKMNWPAKPL